LHHIHPPTPSHFPDASPSHWCQPPPPTEPSTLLFSAS
jgi:hypothetical protein